MFVKNKCLYSIAILNYMYYLCIFKLRSKVKVIYLVHLLSLPTQLTGMKYQGLRSSRSKDMTKIKAYCYCASNFKKRSNVKVNAFFFYIYLYFSAFQFLCAVQRTSDSLNEGLPIKMTREKFQRKLYFSTKKILGSTLDLSTKAAFSLDKYQLKNMGRKLSFCYSTYRK